MNADTNMDTAAATAPQPPQQAGSSAMIITLSLIAALSGFLVVFVYQTTKPIIDENKRMAIEQAVLKVIPDSTAYQPMVLDNGKLVKPGETEGGITIYVAYDKNKDFIGVAADGQAQGYQDKIQLIYGYKPSCECITGKKIIKLAETPGLGDKIITNKDFNANFDALSAKIHKSGTKLAHKIEAVNHGKKNFPWQIDSISGATISSVAVGKAINDSAQVILPQVNQFLAKLKEERYEPAIIQEQ